MKSSLTLTIPDKIRDALQALADERGMGEDVHDLVKNGFMLAMHSPEGWLLKLKPVVKVPDSRQPELPLTSGVCP
jgi:hypothetical protein